MAARIHAAGVTLTMVIAAATPGWAQRTSSNWPSPPPSAQRIPQRPPARNANLEQMRWAAEQQKAQVQKDTGRLNQLVKELKQELDNTPEGTLSVSAIRKSKEIEKLAKQVRKEMQGD